MLLGRDKTTYTTLHAIHTATEIVQQPRLWAATIRMLQSKKNMIHAFLREVSTQEKKIVFTGAGTSEFIGNTASPYLRSKGYKNCVSISSTDLVLDPKSYIHTSDDIVLVSCARSGDSPESIACIQAVEKQASSCRHIVITCNADGTLAHYAQQSDANLVLILDAAHDQGFAMTGSFTSMLLSAVLLFDDVRNIERYAKAYNALLPSIETWIQRIEKDVKDLVARKKNRVICLGSAYLQGIAQESHLKILELSASHNTAMFNTALGFRHGPKSVLNEHSIVFVFVSDNPYTQQYDKDMLRELMSTAGDHHVVAISPKPLEHSALLCHLEIVLPIETEYSLFYALTSMVFAQMYALENALSLGITADNPSPSGSVNRVVQGVTIYPYTR